MAVTVSLEVRCAHAQFILPDGFVVDTRSTLPGKSYVINGRDLNLQLVALEDDEYDIHRGGMDRTYEDYFVNAKLPRFMGWQVFKVKRETIQGSNWFVLRSFKEVGSKRVFDQIQMLYDDSLLPLWVLATSSGILDVNTTYNCVGSLQFGARNDVTGNSQDCGPFHV